MHLHGHNFWVVAEGIGDWDGTVTKSNPQRRDVHILRPGSGGQPAYMVIEFNTDNPGVWPFHCHIAWHVSSGLYVNIMVCLRFSSARESPFVVSPWEARNAWSAHD